MAKEGIVRGEAGTPGNEINGDSWNGKGGLTEEWMLPYMKDGLGS
jgi:hypothetical protein